MNTTTKRLTRSSTDKMFFGVCGGLAEYFDLDPTAVRVGFVLISVLSAAFPGLLVYLIMAALMPKF